ncbi:His-Xaa-Ser repeat protein HxsA [Proteus sp. TJ1640]|uniref:His-Xaa-Ser repeat protein HxsA n=1 Tax=Proteus sp. TJ1640 TaxID=2050968 RepID=UPI000D688B0E|nr:His-Xaa-Ser repeat protein HxsA [Proteus sp. TJ1640]
MKKWSLAALLPGFLSLNSQVIASSTGLPNSELTFEPEDLVFAPLNVETPFYIAGHRSHSSHRSHRSHSSHRSSSGGGYYRSAPSTPSYSQPQTTNRTNSQNSSNSSSNNDFSQSVRNSNFTQEQRKRLVMRVQFALFEKHYFNGVIDGVMGPATRQSIQNYRRDMKLSSNALIDADLLNALGIYATN